MARFWDKDKDCPHKNQNSNKDWNLFHKSNKGQLIQFSSSKLHYYLLIEIENDYLDWTAPTIRLREEKWLRKEEEEFHAELVMIQVTIVFV